MSLLGSVAGAVALGAAVPVITGLSSGAFGKLSRMAGEETVGRAVSLAKHAMVREQSTSLISYTQSARVEPILLMDQKAVYVPFIQDVVHTMSALFTSYYLQAIALDTTLSGVKVLKRLDKFNPDRNLNNATQALLTMESYKHGLPFPGQSVGLEAYGLQPSFESDPFAKNPKHPDWGKLLRKAIVNARVRQEVDAHFKTEAQQLEQARRNARTKGVIDKEFATSDSDLIEKGRQSERVKRALAGDIRTDDVIEEAVKDAQFKKRLDDAIKQALPPEELRSTLSTRDMGKMVSDISNLAVGQIIEVTITEGDQSAKIPVSIRMRVTGMASEVLVETMAVGGVDVTVGSRFRQWRAGELKFWADLVLAQDRIAAHKKAVLKDKSGYYSAVMNRNDQNLLVEVMSQGGPSVGTASSIIVLTEQTKLDLERAISGRLSNYKTRESIFSNTFAMLMAVVDPEWETVVVYHRGIEMPTELTAKDVKKANSGQGPNIAEILAAYQLGSAPSRL